MGLRDIGKHLDNKVLGSSDSKRGFAFNLVSGLHPALVPVYVAAALVSLVIALLLALFDNTSGAVVGVLAACVAAFMAYASRGIPGTPRKDRE